MNPVLRFDYNFSDYKECKLSDLLNHRNIKQCITEDAKLLSFTIEEGIIEPEDKKTNKRDFLTKDMEHKKYLLVEKNDIIYNPSNIKFGAIGRNKLRRGVVSPVYEIFYTNQNPGYIELLVKNKKFINKTLKYLEGTVIKLRTLKYEDFLNILVKIPNLEEQKEIVHFFDILDKKINIHKELLSKYEILKKEIMNQLFNNDLIEEVALCNICTIEKGKQKNATEFISDGKYYLLNGGINPSGLLNEYNTLENTITISEGGSSCGYVNFNKQKFWCGGHCYKVIPQNIKNEYLYYLLKFNENKIMNLRVGSGLPNIQKRDLENFSLMIHDEEKQNYISELLLQYDQKIDFEEQIVSKLELLRKSLLQKMFVY